MSQKVKAIVIKSEERKDKDASVLLFSLEEGKFWATLRGIKSPTSKLKAAKEVFTFGEFLIEDTKGGKLVTGFDCIETFHEITADIDKFYEACAILEVVSKLEFSSTTECGQVFLQTLKSLKSICFKKVRHLYVLNKFLLDVFAIFGYPVFSDHCTGCKSTVFDHLYMNYVSGDLVCVACRNMRCEKLSPVVYSALKILTKTELERLETVKLAQDSELELLKILATNFEARFDSPLNLVGILS